MTTRGNDLSGKCGACRRKVSQGTGCEDCGLWFHWECSGTNSDLAILPWYCNSCVQAKVIKKQEETILSLKRELELARTEIDLLKGELNLVDNCPEEFRTVSNSRRKLKKVPSSLDVKLALTNRFEPLAMLGPQTDGDAIDQPVLEAKPKRKILVLGSSHGRGIGQRLQKAMGDAYAVTSIFKPNADLSNVTGDIGKLCKGFSKEDQVVIVGGPGNSLERNLNYQIEKDLSDIAQKTSHTNVRFVGLFWRHDKPWINRCVREINLRLERSLVEVGAAHIDAIDVSSILRSEHTVHGLHLNPRGKDKLTRLIAESIKGRHIPVVMGVQNHFLG
ncbi:hypothetical protein B7P43_G16355 [Cryptotermes secundus]|uniref:Zinc finger PHD-type domain-containing protein n=2 Tax=Cryptotermes secundus TaxID=105785 RepID=A0A2J7QFJ8_9NEOP|nr:hypothetical protein B7P43_G08346 [Cryptotermes secundus]PNF17174.1 hypothetical protein B7P43_G06580 [Cryptotermes secundus]PNF24251.1 hypothetical protein B7P43_G14999 [Cryptotermes secundus]PNF27146.1 hypothetical protein B7P43_G08538 [Cryptotermes secundus]PNF27349.1 hypothetical protein B7P43_G02423 [Cryptotermes secundus]